MAAQSDKILLEKKAKALWTDKRSFINRMILSGAAIFAACFTFIFFGPLEMVAFGRNSLVFTYKDVTWLLVAAMTAAAVCGTLAVSLLRGKIFNYIVSVIFSITVAGYLQAAVLNGSVGALTGEVLEWSRMKPEMIVSLTVWLAVFFAVKAVCYFYRDLWKNVVIGASALLVFMQLVPAMGIFLGAFGEARIPEGSRYYLLNDGLQEYSANENVMVFILDFMDYKYVEDIYKKEPEFFDDFDGFTGYTNAVSKFCRTRPSVNNILTGYSKNAYQEHSDEYFRKSWESQSPHVLDVLKEKEFKIEIYTDFYELFSNGEIAEKYVSNIAEKNDDLAVVPGRVLKKLMYLSAYRYAPTVIKPFFWEYTSFYNEGVFYNTGKTDDSDTPKAELYSTDNALVLGMLMEANATRTENCFKLYHVDGSHPPCYLNRYGETKGDLTDEFQQTQGCLHLMKSVFSRMKELGIYEDATIIVTADHGDTFQLFDESFAGQNIAFFYKPSGSAQTPFVWSDAQVSTSDIVPTIAKAVGGEFAQFGVALDDVGDETRERVFYRVYGNDKEEYLDVYHIVGDASDFSNWKLMDTQEVKHAFY